MNACFRDGQEDESLRWTAERVHPRFMSSSQLTVQDKISLKFGKVEQLLKPLTSKGKAEELEESRLINDAKERQEKGISPVTHQWSVAKIYIFHKFGQKVPNLVIPKRISKFLIQIENPHKNANSTSNLNLTD